MYALCPGSTMATGRAMDAGLSVPDRRRAGGPAGAAAQFGFRLLHLILARVQNSRELTASAAPY
jgi:hypothetical protein